MTLESTTTARTRRRPSDPAATHGVSRGVAKSFGVLLLLPLVCVSDHRVGCTPIPPRDTTLPIVVPPRAEQWANRYITIQDAIDSNLGAFEGDFRDAIGNAGSSVQVVCRDGNSLAVTLDYVEGRVYATVERGRVESAAL
jgi:hypothetical protein